jgi:hypothetical protein
LKKELNEKTAQNFFQRTNYKKIIFGWKDDDKHFSCNALSKNDTEILTSHLLEIEDRPNCKHYNICVDNVITTASLYQHIDLLRDV